MRIIYFGIHIFQGQINAITLSSIYTNAKIPYNTAKKVHIFLNVVIQTINIKTEILRMKQQSFLLFLNIISEVIKSVNQLSTNFFTTNKIKTFNNLIVLAVIMVES